MTDPVFLVRPDFTLPTSSAHSTEGMELSFTKILEDEGNVESPTESSLLARPGNSPLNWMRLSPGGMACNGGGKINAMRCNFDHCTVKWNSMQ